MTASGGTDRALKAINDISAALLEGRDSDAVLQLIAKRARKLVGASYAAIATPVGDGESLVLRVTDGVEAEALRGVVFPIEDSISGDVFRSGSAVLVKDLSTHPSTGQPIARVPFMRTAFVVPMSAGERSFGTLGVVNRHGDPDFSPEDCLLVETFGHSAAVAMQHSALGQEVDRLKLLEERQRIARELHDGVVQALFAVGLTLQGALDAVGSPEETQERISDAISSIDRTIRDLRDYIFGLQPQPSDEGQLAAALRELAAVYRGATPAELTVSIDDAAASALTHHSVDVLQLVREGLSNAVRHAKAGRISLELASSADGVVLDIRDDGRGFDPGQPSGGMGLQNLGIRASALDGVLEIDAAPGRGTHVRVVVRA